MDQGLYAYSPIVARPRLTWPDGAKVAFYVGLNIEHYRLDLPSTSTSGATVGLVPDPMNYGWRDYGPRVGVWRIAALLDELGIRASVPLNSEACAQYPQIIEWGVERDWVWVGHGQTNSMFQAGMERDAERDYLVEMTDTIEKATGSRPRGWLGPALTETLATPDLLSELGYQYVMDWCNDEQPYRLNRPGMYSVPYSVELNDISVFTTGHATGAEYEQMIVDQLEQLLADGTDSGRVMALPLHPFVTGHPFRYKYLARALRRIVETPGVWVTTSDDILDHYTGQETS